MCSHDFIDATMNSVIKMRQINGSAGILIHNGKIGAFRRKYGEYRGFYEFPGGKIEENETPEQALIRECYEELNILIQINRFFTTITHQYDDFVLTLDLYICSFQDDNFSLRVHDDVQWVDQYTLDSLPWIAADVQLLPQLKQLLESLM